MVKIYIYTAVFGGYDNLPGIEVYDEEIEYYCFTNVDIPGVFPWKNVLTPCFFRDNKLNSGFLKTNAHLLFPWDSIVVWIDANLIDVKLSKKRILEFVSEESVAVTKHFARRSVFGEIAVVAEHGLDDKVRISRWENELRSLGYPDNSGLAETRLLIRDLRNPKVRAANETWWDTLLRGSRRDQLSFNPALWMHNVVWNDIEIDDQDVKSENKLFAVSGHKNASCRVIGNQAPMHNLEMIAPYFWSAIELPLSLPKEYPNTSIYPYEFWDSETLSLLRIINNVVQESQESVKDNYCNFHNSQVCAMSIPDIRLSWKREYLRRATLPAKFGLKIGFNAGHSAVIMLGNNPALKLVCVDAGANKYCIPCADILAKYFGYRFSIQYGRSRDLLGELSSTWPLQNLDFVHIDGNSEIDDFVFDLGWFMEVAPINCRLIVEEAYIFYVSEVLQFLINKNMLKPCNPGLSSYGENRLFIKRDNIQKAELIGLVERQEFINKDLIIKNLERIIAEKDDQIKLISKGILRKILDLLYNLKQKLKSLVRYLYYKGRAFVG